MLTIPRKVRQLESTRGLGDILALVVGSDQGRIAKRRDAYIRHISEQQCVDPLDVPGIHQQGQSGLLFTPATWEPESSEEDEPDRTECPQDPLTHPSRPCRRVPVSVISSIRIFSVRVAFDIPFGCILRHWFCALVLTIRICITASV